MNSILALARKRKFQAKTEKSFTNILTGYKSHQTYFDALMQNMLPFYNSFKADFKFPEHVDISQADDHYFYPYFYDSSMMTFQALRLVTQSLSAKSTGRATFYPVTNHLYVQQQAKYCYSLFNASPDDFQQKLLALYKSVHEQLQFCCSYLLLPNGSGSHFSREEIGRQFHLQPDELDTVLLKEINFITEWVRRDPILSMLYIRIPLHSATEKTAQLLKQQLSIEQIAAMRQVKRHTIEDHLIEMMIKDYALDWQQFVSEDEVAEIRTLYHDYSFERLKPFYEHSSIDDYFKVKLALCVVIKEVHHGAE